MLNLVSALQIGSKAESQEEYHLRMSVMCSALWSLNNFCFEDDFIGRLFLDTNLSSTMAALLIDNFIDV